MNLGKIANKVGEKVRLNERALDGREFDGISREVLEIIGKKTGTVRASHPDGTPLIRFFFSGESSFFKRGLSLYVTRNYLEAL